LEVEPKTSGNCICLIEADVEVDFAPPLDYVEAPPLMKKTSSINLDDDEETSKGPFSGQGIKINGQKVEASHEKKVDNEEYDPRKHRLHNGVRQNIFGYEFKGNGVAVGGKIDSFAGMGIKKEGLQRGTSKELP